MYVRNTDIIIPINSVELTCDYETSERCGAGGMFQISSAIAVTEDGEFDISNQIDQGKYFSSKEDVAEEMGWQDIDIEIM